MTKDEIIQMAREANIKQAIETPHLLMVDELERFAALVAEKEREACARICDTTPPQPFRPSIEAAHAIRARGNSES